MLDLLRWTDVSSFASTGSWLFNLWLDARQSRAGGRHENGKQRCRLRGARVFADEMNASGRLEEGLTRLIDSCRTGCGVLRANCAREHIGHNASSMRMARRTRAWRIANDDRGERLARQIGQRAGECDALMTRRFAVHGKEQRCTDRKR